MLYSHLFVENRHVALLAYILSLQDGSMRKAMSFVTPQHSLSRIALTDMRVLVLPVIGNGSRDCCSERPCKTATD